MTHIHKFQQPLPRFIILCRDILINKLWSGAAYGARANIYRSSDINDLELSSPKYLLLALLYSLVTGDVMSCVVLADICQRVEKLKSRHHKVWLLEDFVFPRPDIQKAVALLTQLLADGTLKLSPHLLGIMASLANKYEITGVQLRTLSEEGRRDLAIQLENAVADNSPRDIFDLASEGADIHGLTQSGDSLLHLAALADNSASIAALCFLKAELEVVNSNNETPLEVAVWNNCLSSIKALLMAGARFDKRTRRGDTFLHFTAREGYKEALEILLKEGIEVNEKNNVGETPLIEAARNSEVDIVTILLLNGADTKIKDKDGRTALHYAAKRGCLSSASSLLNAGAEVDEKDNKGDTPAILAAVKKKQNVLQLLIESGANLHSKDSYYGDGILHHAASSGYVDIVKRVLDAGVSVDLKSKSKMTALHYAAWGGHIAVVTALLDAGAVVDMQCREQNTALHYAAQQGHTAVVTTLLDHGADPAAKTVRGNTPLTVASLYGHLAVVQLLLDRGAPLNVRAEGRTALGWAYYNRQSKVADYLKSKGGVE